MEDNIFNMLHSQIEENKRNQEKSSDRVNAHDSRITKIESTYEQLFDKVKEIERDIKELTNSLKNFIDKPATEALENKKHFGSLFRKNIINYFSTILLSLILFYILTHAAQIRELIIGS